MRLSPLNIVVACLMVWTISEYGSEGDVLLSWGWLILLVVILIVTDVLFRIWLSDNQKLWVYEILFILIVGVGSVAIKLI